MARKNEKKGEERPFIANKNLPIERKNLCTYFITTQMHDGSVYLLKVLLHSRTIHRSGKRRRPKKPFLLQQLRHRGGGIEERRRGRDALCLSFSFSPGEEQPPKQAPQPFAAATDRRRHRERRRGKKRGEARPSVPLPFIQFSSSLLHPAGGGGWRWRGREGGRMGGRGFPFCPPLQLFLF